MSLRLAIVVESAAIAFDVFTMKSFRFHSFLFFVVVIVVVCLFVFFYLQLQAFVFNPGNLVEPLDKLYHSLYVLLQVIST